ncbi:trypsin-like peptidase domain-containing protein [Kibdelosporangium persicum]|uniref:ORC1/DEAH AAA+ ATPase domain-containing protein n=1 Tax=Kibdelosporangium persicum TaxID=2698649 RepID=A0ABX2FHY4_9PSEU|nr:trypsin-like peptidase domain-containing protein [Kibdelosporangium persicum]NRN71001.1 hypothetical protein [Kibdelosporangium persicum]
METRLLAERPPWLVRIHDVEGRVVGGGFLVSDRLVVTCAHVVSQALGCDDPQLLPVGEIEVSFPFADGPAVTSVALTEAWFPITVDGQGDMAVLTLRSPAPPGTLAAPLSRPVSAWGHHYRTHGFPRGMTGGVWARGTVTGPVGPGWDWIQIEDEKPSGHLIQPGFSGSPVWDDELRSVIGMVVAQDRLREARTAYMIPIRVLARLWPPLEESIRWRLIFDPDLRTHWGPRSRGVERSAWKGWYFTGRVNVLRELVGWLTGRVLDGRIRVVTGGPGSGKSATLARLVTLADPDYRRLVPLGDAEDGTVPPVGVIDVAVNAKGRTIDEVTRSIAQAVDAEVESADELIESVLERAKPLTVVVDALDEADEPDRIARELLRPLAADAGSVGVRVLVGARRVLLPVLRISGVVYDLDEPSYLDPEDLVVYSRRCLLLSDDPDGRTPYRDRTELADTVARAVAARAYPTFLVARLVSRFLTEAATPIDVTDPGWHEHLPDSVADAMDSYLSRFGENERRVCDLLMPLAYVEGRGLPADQLWLSLANALARTEYQMYDIQWLLNSPAAAYLLESTMTDGKVVYRLFHEALAEYLRRDRHDQTTQRLYAETLLANVPDRQDGTGKDWERAHSYARSYFPSHAGKGGVLDALVEDPRFLVAVDPSRLELAVPSLQSAAGRQAGRAFTVAARHLRTKPPEEHLSYLELAAHMTGAQPLAKRIDRLPVVRPWTVRWASWRQGRTHNVCGRHDGWVRAVRVGELDGKPIIVSGSEDGTIRIWDATARCQIGEPLVGHLALYAIALTRCDDRQVIVSGGREGTVRVWDLADHSLIGAPLAAHDDTVAALAVGRYDGRTVLATGSWDGKVQVWDLGSREPIGRPFTGHGDWVSGVAITQIEGRTVVVTGGNDNHVRVWDLADGTEACPPLTGHTDWLNAVAIGDADGRRLVVSAAYDGTVRRWDLASGEPVGPPMMGHDGPVHAVATGELDGRPVVASGGRDGAVLLWDLSTGAPIGAPFMENDGRVSTVTMAVINERAVLVSGASDGTVRMFATDTPSAGDVSGTGPSSDSGVHTSRLTSVDVVDRPEGAILVSASADRTIRRWHVDTGRLAGPPLIGHESTVHSLSAGRIGDTPVVVTASRDRTVRVWRVADGTSVGEPLTGHHERVLTVAMSEVSGTPVAVSGSADHTVRVWDLARGTPIGAPLAGHGGSVLSVAVGDVFGRPMIVSGSADHTIRLWDLEYGTPLGLLRIYGPVHAVTIGEFEGRPVIVSGSREGTVRIWDLRRDAVTTFAGLLGDQTLIGHRTWVTAVAIRRHPGGNTILSCSHDGTIRAWRPDGGLHRLIDVGADIHDLALVDDDTMAVSTSMGLLVLHWNRH